MNELVSIESTEIATIFSDGGIDPIIQKIKDEVIGNVPDVATAGGRSEIASLAHKVARSKTYLDGLGKDLVSGIKKQAKVIDAERKKMRDKLDDLKAEVRQPLTEWEAAERNRISAHLENLNAITDAKMCCNGPLEIMVDTLTNLELMTIDDSWEEFEKRAIAERSESVAIINDAIERLRKYNAEQAELAKFRAEQAERERKDREEALRREGEERAKRQAEAAAQEAVRRAEAAVESEKKAKLLAYRREQHAKDQAKANAEAAARRERDNIAREKEAEEKAAKRRKDDQVHRINVVNMAVDALTNAGLLEEHAAIAVEEIAKGNVPFVQIHF